MDGCIYRTRSDLCMKFTTDKSISFCVGKKCPDRKESNADRIRSMTDEELANELLEWFACFSAVEWTRDMILNWLKQEVTE